jgi:hypothetical protein
MACGSQPAAEFLPSGLSSLTDGLSLGPNSTAAELVAVVETLRAIIRERGVTHVHAHPFTSLFPGMLAAALEGVPFMLTLHGPASLSTGYGAFNDFLFAALVLPSASTVIAVSEEVGDLAAPYVENEKLCIQCNAVNFGQFRHADSALTEAAPWLVVSRLDAVKIHGIRQFVNYANALGLGRVDIVGDGPGRAVLREWLEADGVVQTARFLGARSDVHDLMRMSAGVAGMGRALLEGVACAKPVCMVGYDGVKGLIDTELFRQAAYANFSGRNLPNRSLEELAQQFNRGLLQTTELRAIAVQDYSEDMVWSEFSKRITSFTRPKSRLIRAIYSVLQSEEVVGSRMAYLASEDLFYRIGRVLHSAAFFSPTIAASYAFYESRMHALRLAKWQEESQAALRASEAMLRETQAGLAQADAHNAEEMGRISDELQRVEEQGKHHADELAMAIKAVENAVGDIDTRLQEKPRNWSQRISDAMRSRSGRSQ